MEEPSRIGELVGEEVSAVCFVRDFFEIHFEEKNIRILTDMDITVGSVSMKFPDTGSRELLCKLIDRRLEKIVIADQQRLRLNFENSMTLSNIQIETDDGLYEIIHYIPGINRPGDTEFWVLGCWPPPGLWP